MTAVNTSVTLYTVTMEVAVSELDLTRVCVCVHLALLDYAASRVSKKLTKNSIAQ